MDANDYSPFGTLAIKCYKIVLFGSMLQVGLSVGYDRIASDTIWLVSILSEYKLCVQYDLYD